MRYLFSLAVLSGLAGQATAADCELGGRYTALAQQQLKTFAMDEAQAYLQKAVEVCPTHAAYQQLGEIAAQSTEAEKKAQAVDAFVRAHELASTDKDRAESLYHYAQLLDAAGDPQNAYPLIKSAKTLDAGDAKIIALDKKLDEQIRNPTTEQLRAGLKGSLFRPLRLASGGPTTAQSVPAPASAPRTGNARGTNNVPIHFVTGTTVVDEQTRPNLKVLASALADPELAGNNFVLVGHADERGDEAENMTLSWQRGTAIRNMLQSMQPTLKGRLDVSGRGELEPLDPGHDENAYRTNRRVQVVPK